MQKEYKRTQAGHGVLGRQGCLGALFLNLPIGLVYKRMQEVQRSLKCVQRNWGFLGMQGNCF